MQENFFNNESDFDRLVTMFKCDRLPEISIKAGYVLSVNENYRLSQEQIDGYYYLMKKLGISEIIKGEGNARGIIYLTAWHKSGFVGASTKFYLFAESPPCPLVDSLDESSNGDAHTCKHLKGNWYLHLDIW